MLLPLASFGFGGGELLVIFFILMAFFVLPLCIVPAVLAYVVLDRIPAADRKQEPALALLLLIPFFSMIWAFFVYPRISDSLISYFNRRGDPSVGDCGRSLALIMCICGLIPFVHLVALVCMVLFFVKTFELTSRIRRLNSPIAATVQP